MSVKIIYGRSGCGKTDYIYKKVLENIDQKQRQYIITPEQFSYTAEKRLVDSLKEGATTKVEVLSFERMAHRVMNETIVSDKPSISQSGKAMIVFNSINKNKKNLKFLGKSLENIDMILTQITEFKKHNITVEMLKNAYEKIENEYLKIKLEDMIILYEDMQDKIGDNFIDENDMLTILADNIEKSHLFDNAVFYIDEFAGFTKQEYSVIAAINNVAKDVYITVCTDELNIYKSPEADVFYDNKQTVQTLVSMFDLEKANQIKLEKNYRFKNEELKHLEKNIFSIPYNQYDEECKNIKLTLADNNYEEIEYVASEIIKLVKNENYRYRDIAVISNNVGSYSNLCKAIFDEYDIPVFIDEKKDITQNVVIKYVLSIIEIMAKSWTYESVFNYLKTGLVDIDNLYELEKYCLKWGIKGKKWFEAPWDYEEGNNFNDEQNKITTPILNLIDSFNKKKTVRELTENLYSFLVVNLTEKIKASDNEENVDAWNIIIDVFEEIVNIFGDDNISFENYLKLLQIGISSKELGKIPEAQDKVIFGDVNRSKTHKVKAVFLIGVNDGSFPSINTSEGYFNDKDRSSFKKDGIELAKGTREKMYEENFNIYKAFSTAEEKLFVSYVSSDAEGAALRKSLFIARLQKIFTKLSEDSVDKNTILNKESTFNNMLNNLQNPEWNMVYKWYEKNEPEKLKKALMGLKYSNVPEKISEENINKLYGDSFKTTVSKMEKYMSCPFSYFLQYGLRIQDEDRYEIKALDTGSFMHEVIDEFFKTVVTRNNRINDKQVESFKELDDEEIEKVISEIIEEKLDGYVKFKLTAKSRVLIQRLKRVVYISIKYIVDSLKNSEFEILGNEISFGSHVPKANDEENIDYETKNYPPIKIELENGKKIIIEGKIDRVDIARLPDGNYIRVIDYKSSAKELELHKVLAGLQLQLITYVDAVCKNEDVLPAGALYYGLLEPKIKAKNRNAEKEELEKILRENYKMNGYVLADVNVIKAMDKTLEKGKSEIIPVTLNEGGDISFKSSKVVTEKEFNNMQKYVEKIIKQISKEILSGEIGLKPYYLTNKKKTPCEYCEYKSICQFDTKFKGNKYRIIMPENRDDILNKMENEVK